MWPFSKKREKQAESPVVTDLIEKRDLSDLSSNQATLRVWLPEEGKIALDQVVGKSGAMYSKFLREFFVIYLYGIHELVKMQERAEGLYFKPAPVPSSYRADYHSEEIRYSRAPTVECIPGLGKNIFPLKIHLPQRIKDDLQLAADRAGIALSQFVREILISYFFGHTFWPAKLKIWTDDQEKIGVEWEQGERESLTVDYAGSTPFEIGDDQVIEEICYR